VPVRVGQALRKLLPQLGPLFDGDLDYYAR
jgi:hypothetical protein